MLLALHLLNLLEEAGAPSGTVIVYGSLYMRDFAVRL